MTSVAQMLDYLNSDLANEYKHWHFYLHAASKVQSLHREAIRSFLLSEAKSEMGHILEFADLIVGLDGEPKTTVNGFRSDFKDPKSILQYALEMESEVVANYVARKKQAKDLGGVNGAVIDAFLDGQILASRHDIDNIKQMLAGC